MNEEQGFEDHKDLDTPETHIPTLIHFQCVDETNTHTSAYTHTHASTQITSYQRTERINDT